jgi:hypothetical protein
MGLNDVFNQLKLGVVGTKTSSIDQKLDHAVKDILQYKSNSGRLGYIDLMKNIISKSASQTLSNNSFGNNIFSQLSNPSAFGQGQRLGRYKMYESIVSYIGYCQRAMTVIVDNVLSPDDITKTSLEINPKKFLDNDSKSMGEISYIKELIATVKLEKYLDVIVSSCLQNGDFFVEIADQKTALISRSYLAENVINLHTKEDTTNSFVFENKESTINVKVKIDYSLLYEDESINKRNDANISTLLTTDPDGDKTPTKKYLKNYKLVLHDPSRVVKLQSELYPLCFGYLIFPKFSVSPGMAVADQSINDICKDIIGNIAKKIPRVGDLEKDDEIKEIITNIIKETNSQMLMTIRYVPPDKIQHFQKPSVKNYPYGQSLFFGTEFNAKVLISLETALAVQRINRSTEKRKIGIEIGLPRDAQKMIQKLKEQFRKRKVSIDSYGSVDTIASTISTFEDIYIPMKDGKPFIDISTFTEGNVDIRSKVDELKYMRDSIIASLQVPPSFIGIEENLSNKCIILGTYIKLTSGKNVTLENLIDEFNLTGTITDKYSYSYDKETGKIVPGKIIWAGVTRKNAEVVKVTLDNGMSEIVTPDHHFMNRYGVYVEAKDLKVGDSLMPSCIESNHKVVSVEYLTETYDTGDITVEKYHNFAVGSGIIISNSALSEENILFARAVVNHQKYLSEQVSELIEKIISIVDPEKATYILNNLSISFSAPKSLQFERETRYTSDLANLIETLERLGIPKSYSIKKYLTSIDWLDLKSYETSEQIDKTLGTQKDDEDQFGGMGGMGGMPMM